MSFEFRDFASYGLGTPMCWLFNYNGDMLLDSADRPLGRHVNEFEYTYDEEGDDTCKIKFLFPEPYLMDTPQVSEDMVILVQWGFLLPNRTFIKSPIRKVAIRDLEREYSTEGLKATIECTDLVSYLRMYKTQSMRKYENPNANKELVAVDSKENNFLSWINGTVAGDITPTVTYKNKIVRFDYLNGQGVAKVADYDEDKDKVTFGTRDNTSMPRKWFQEFFVAKTVVGKGKPLYNVINDQLRALGIDSPDNFLMDSTDDNLHIHKRNYNKPIYKTYQWAKGDGSLIKFKPSTKTRKIKDDKTSTANVNPYSKEIEEITNEVADTQNDENSEDKTLVGDFTETHLKQAYKEFKEAYTQHIENPTDQKPLTKEVNYFVARDKVRAKQGYYDISSKNKDSIVRDNTLETRGFYSRAEAENGGLNYRSAKLKTSEIVALPEFQDMATEMALEIKTSARKAQVLKGFAMEKIQRKNEASATVLGDPSLIKGKIYQFTNLSKRDSGLWYAVKVKHKITMGSGYAVEMSLVRKPKTIGMSTQTYNAKLSLLDDTERIELNKLITQDTNEFHNKGKAVKNLFDKLDTPNIDSPGGIDPQDPTGMLERLKTLGEDEEFIFGKNTAESNFKPIEIGEEDSNTEEH